MPYELTVVANTRDRHDRGEASVPRISTLATLLLAGTLDAEATNAIFAALGESIERGVDSIVVEFADVRIGDRVALDVLVDGVMSLRADGVHVQIFARADALQDRLATLPDSRDWLLSRSADGSSLPRQAIHLDGPAS